MEHKLTLRRATEPLIVIMAVTILILAGCGGSSKSAPASVSKGVVYPLISGLEYQTNSTTGVVAADGSYNYKASENVTFRVGGIDIATVPAGPKVTPLPLNNDAASTNMLRFFKGLDTNNKFSDGIALPVISKPTAETTPPGIDWTNEAVVAAAQKLLVPTSTLPAGSDAELKTVLDSAKSTAVQSLGSYGSKYSAIIVGVDHEGTSCSSDLSPKNAVVTFTAEPFANNTNTVGSVTVTLNNNSTATFPLKNDGIYGPKGTFTTQDGSSLKYDIYPDFVGSRIIKLRIGNNGATNITNLNSCAVVLRDNSISQPNKPPVPLAQTWITISNAFNATFGRSDGSTFGVQITGDPLNYCLYESDYQSGKAGGGAFSGSFDLDGFIVSQLWTSSKGKTGTDKTFKSDGCVDGKEDTSTTLTVTDDEGATASKTYPCCKKKAGTIGTTGGSAPTISGFSPSTGTVGTSVTITGTNFSATPANNIVMINGVQAIVTAATATSLTITIPGGATSGTISVTTAGKTAISSSSFTMADTRIGSLTLSAPFSSLPNLRYDPSSDITREGAERYWNSFSSVNNNLLNGHVFISYSVPYLSGAEVLMVVVTDDADNTMYPSGPTSSVRTCTVSGTYFDTPSCASYGITLNKSSGTINFASTPVHCEYGVSSGKRGTMSGSLSFNPF